ncbi:MAG: B12-binding domain-containing radical SAM protein [Hyphomicrobiales bacterium]|nr:B12-binding domain-containing radical SAM protein [Hyphomicrobiales bacterium]
MKIAFVVPNMFKTRAFDAIEPLVFAILAARTPDDVEVVFWDERREDVPLDPTVDLVALTVETHTARRAYQIARQYRALGAAVVMGGHHPTFMADEALSHCDAIVRGDAEGVWEELVADFRAGRMRSVYTQTETADLADLRLDRSIFKGKGYAPATVIQYGRGCKFNCEFCSIRAFYGSCLRQRPVADVVDEIERMNHRHVFFIDDNIFVDTDKAKELFRALIPLNVTWSCQMSIDIAQDRELMKLLEKSGCAGALIGFESLNPENLKQMRKGWGVKRQDYETSIRILQDAGVMIYGSFVFGYDADTPDSFAETVDFAVRNRFFLGNFAGLMPTPGAKLYDRLRDEGRLLHERWWLDPDFRYGNATFVPRGMTPRQLTDGCHWARTQFYTAGSIFHRLWDRDTNIRNLHRAGYYLAANLVFRREAQAKHGQILGGDMALVPAEAGD